MAILCVSCLNALRLSFSKMSSTASSALLQQPNDLQQDLAHTAFLSADTGHYCD